MPFTTIPTLSDGSVLSASHLNTLADDVEFLNGVTNRANVPFNSYRISGDLAKSDMIWFGRHRVPYLHYSVTHGSADHVRIFFNDVLVAHDESSPASPFAGYVNVEDYTTLPNLVGAWVTSHGYNSFHDTNDGDGDVVTNGGAYYDCITTHTSDAAKEPGVGVSWHTYWVLITPPTVGAIFFCYADVDSGGEITVEYMIESDSTTF